MLRRHEPALVAVDSPCSVAPRGRLREGERRLRHAVCGIRWTPDRPTLDGSSPYYEWIRLGLALYEALRRDGWEWIEVFPTASWTRWAGPRQGSRAAWTTAAVSKLATITSASQAATSVTINSPGTYTFLFSADDSVHSVAFDAIVVPRPR